MGQYQDHSWGSVFWAYHSHGRCDARVRMGLYEQSTEPECRELSSGQAGKAAHAYDQTILETGGDDHG